MTERQAALLAGKLLHPSRPFVVRITPAIDPGTLAALRETLEGSGAAIASLSAAESSDFETSLWHELDRVFDLYEAHAWNWNAVEEALRYLDKSGRSAFITIVIDHAEAERRFPTAFKTLVDVFRSVGAIWRDRGVAFKLLLA